jgi:hypothetical protein
VNSWQVWGCYLVILVVGIFDRIQIRRLVERLEAAWRTVEALQAERMAQDATIQHLQEELLYWRSPLRHEEETH